MHFTTQWIGSWWYWCGLHTTTVACHAPSTSSRIAEDLQEVFSYCTSQKNFSAAWGRNPHSSGGGVSGEYKAWRSVTGSADFFYSVNHTPRQLQNSTSNSTSEATGTRNPNLKTKLSINYLSSTCLPALLLLQLLPPGAQQLTPTGRQSSMVKKFLSK